MQDLTRDGVRLCYEEAGNGSPSIVLVHGGFNDHSFFAPQVEHLGKSHRCIAVDLRGHGQSGTPESEYSVGVFADDVAWMCHELGVSKPIVIGHSLGGLVALEMAAKFGDLPSAIVILDSPVLAPELFKQALQPLAEALRTEMYQEAARSFIEQFVGFTDDPKRREEVLEFASTKTPQHVMASAIDGYIGYDTVSAVEACKVPVLFVSAGTPIADLAAFKEKCPQLVVGQTVGSGHYMQLEVPDQINSMIDRFVALSTASPEG